MPDFSAVSNSESVETVIASPSSSVYDKAGFSAPPSTLNLASTSAKKNLYPECKQEEVPGFVSNTRVSVTDSAAGAPLGMRANTTLTEMDSLPVNNAKRDAMVASELRGDQFVRE